MVIYLKVTDKRIRNLWFKKNIVQKILCSKPIRTTLGRFLTQVELQKDHNNTTIYPSSINKTHPPLFLTQLASTVNRDSLLLPYNINLNTRGFVIPELANLTMFTFISQPT